MPPRFSPPACRCRVDDDKCIADKGCTVCVDVCPLDVLAIDISKGKAYMKFDECWYCMPCEKDCPTGAVTRRHPLPAALNHKLSAYKNPSTGVNMTLHQRNCLPFPGGIAMTARQRSAETIRVAIGTQDTTINCATGGLLIRELKLLEKYLPHDGKYKDVDLRHPVEELHLRRAADQ
jgi:NAD-dependent dihydropyrimidine dehydrogenase PreA subunit